MGSNTCYSCGKPSHMVKDYTNSRSLKQAKERVQPNGPSEEAPRRQQFFALNFMGVGDDSSGNVS